MPLNSETKVPPALKTKEIHHQLRFECKGCGQCCDRTIIYLHPFDLKAICDFLKITILEFHQKYTMFKLDENNIWRCALRNRPSCPFKNADNKCSIYDFRPLLCRLYPVGRFVEENEVSYLISNYRCRGFESHKKHSIAEWLELQGVVPYRELTDKWNRFLLSLKNDPLLSKKMQDKTVQESFKKIFYGFEISPELPPQTVFKELTSAEQLGIFMDTLYREFDIFIKN